MSEADGDRAPPALAGSVKKSDRQLKRARAEARSAAARKKRGRTQVFVPTDEDREQVALLSGYGLPFEQIASLVQGGINVDTMRNYFSVELLNGKSKANAQVGKGLFQRAMAGEIAALIWWSKTQMKWREGEPLGDKSNPIHVKNEGTTLAVDIAKLMRAAKREA